MPPANLTRLLNVRAAPRADAQPGVNFAALATPAARNIATIAGSRVLDPRILRPLPIPDAVPVPMPAPAPAPAPVVPMLPAVPDENPFNHLPRPSPGDRIRADDFRQLSSCLELVHDSALLSAAVFGFTLAEARSFITSQGRAIAGVLSVFGAVLNDGSDPSLDQRRVVQVLPVVLGEPEVHVVVTEAVETRRLTPTLAGLSYRTAVDQVRGSLGQGTVPAVAMRAPSLVDLSLAAAVNAVTASNTRSIP